MLPNGHIGASTLMGEAADNLLFGASKIMDVAADN